MATLEPLHVEIVEYFGKLHAIEMEARYQDMNVEERRELREAKSRLIMNQIKQRMLEIRQEIMPGSSLAKACDYGLKQWPRMEVYLSQGHIEIDNNRCYAALGITPVMPPPDLCRAAKSEGHFVGFSKASDSNARHN